jgi:hypothetical protein
VFKNHFRYDAAKDEERGVAIPYGVVKRKHVAGFYLSDDLGGEKFGRMRNGVLAKDRRRGNKTRGTSMAKHLIMFEQIPIGGRNNLAYIVGDARTGEASPARNFTSAASASGSFIAPATPQTVFACWPTAASCSPATRSW